MSKTVGYAIYPGKVTEAETFRIGNIGEIYPDDIEKLYEIMKEFLEEQETMRAMKTVIFDWAGTTVDDGCFAPVRAFMEIFKEYGVVPTIERGEQSPWGC